MRAGADREPIEARRADAYEAPSSGEHSVASQAEQQSMAKRKGAVAQLGERLLCKQEVIGSIPFTSTTLKGKRQQMNKETVA